MSHAIAANDVSQAAIDKLSAKLNERSWEKIFTVLHLRQHLKSYKLLRRTLSSLWLAVIYRPAQQCGAGTTMVPSRHDLNSRARFRLRSVNYMPFSQSTR
jgi:hypothetical protein